MAGYLRITPEEVVHQLQQLTVYHVLEYEPMKDTPQLYYLYNRVPSDQVLIDEKMYAARKALYKEQITAMVNYASVSKACRSSIIRQHFGDKQIDDCGICDNCLAIKQSVFGSADLAKAQAAIAAQLNRPITSLQLRRLCLQIESSLFDAALQKLQEEEKIMQQADGTFVLNG
jgi:ATP-dependent DNA helicase RecQ